MRTLEEVKEEWKQVFYEDMRRRAEINEKFQKLIDEKRAIMKENEKQLKEHMKYKKNVTVDDLKEFDRAEASNHQDESSQESNPQKQTLQPKGNDRMSYQNRIISKVYNNCAQNNEKPLLYIGGI